MIRRVTLGMALAGLLIFHGSAGETFVPQSPQATPETVALWLFDEQAGIYPSSVLSDQGPNDYPLVIGPGGQIVAGKFGNALAPIPQPAVKLPSGEARFGLAQLATPEGRKVPPMSWMEANFAALMTSGENHLRKEVGFPRVTETKLNLGEFDWTVEFWFMPNGESSQEGVVLEIGQGPRGENDRVTRLSLNPGRGFTLYNQPAGTVLQIPSNARVWNSSSQSWHHLVFDYSAAQKQVRHYVDGILQELPEKCTIRSLERGKEDYFTVGRDGLWGRPLYGLLDELRVSAGRVYQGNFTPPESFSSLHQAARPQQLAEGPPLLFAQDVEKNDVVELGNRRHLFIDDALVAEMSGITFTVNPPRPAESVIDRIEGPYRKHLTVLEDEDGLLRMYNSIDDDFLAVRISKDGIHWEIPDLGRGLYKENRNIVLAEMVGGLGTPFIDPNGPPEARWKMITDYHRRGIFLYTSPDGWNWTRHKTAVLPFRSGTQSCTFYDDQRQMYVSYHRTGIAQTPGGATQRESVLTETRDIFAPWPFNRVSQEESWQAAKSKALREPLPWYLDNGPLTPGGFGLEYPHKFVPVESLDPVGTDIYVTKAMKYPWAPDVYLAFPIVYFHYEKDGPKTRQVLMDPERGRGSGPIETQLAVSRDGVNWKRYPRPAYVGIGKHGRLDVKQAYLAHGMVRRGDEIWQYYYGTDYYHSTWQKDRYGEEVFRVVQRLDGFVSADAPYDREALLKTKPLRFEGNRLILNIDTEATGYAQVGFLDEMGVPIPGYFVDDCVYINGDFTAAEVEWLNQGKDVSTLAGKTVQVVFRMRGSKLYAFQFTDRSGQ